jgi:hypothetical protein
MANVTRMRNPAPPPGYRRRGRGVGDDLTTGVLVGFAVAVAVTVRVAVAVRVAVNAGVAVRVAVAGTVAVRLAVAEAIGAVVGVDGGSGVEEGTAVADGGIGVLVGVLAGASLVTENWAAALFQS